MAVKLSNNWMWNNIDNTAIIAGVKPSIELRNTISRRHEKRGLIDSAAVNRELLAHSITLFRGFEAPDGTVLEFSSGDVQGKNPEDVLAEKQRFVEYLYVNALSIWVDCINKMQTGEDLADPLT